LKKFVIAWKSGVFYGEKEERKKFKDPDLSRDDHGFVSAS
jgi:hypothetical protein